MKRTHQRFFVTGIGTGVGKTVVSACVAEALDAHYWKPIQSGLEEETDTEFIQRMTTHPEYCYPEGYRLKTPASPHLAARIDGVEIDVQHIVQLADQYQTNDRPLIIEGAGGLMVPINEDTFTLELVQQLEARVILVAMNYLGSINHSLLTAMALQQANVPVAGWIFNGEYNTNEDDIVRWTKLPKIGRILQANVLDKAFITHQAAQLKPSLIELLGL
ncbi:dethiobiotin synthetase [Chitinophaga skermanii]|uniref:ATP-dependent dethiobiotin synthetase BioD n=1 Tax=Chitinophaga skermanii TaxID=331697 RepID=A0A327QRG5_9BACT|nr:dethiobiotin synthase [Chitinophaga skermanii]RAJ06841.1 dethiobiotin synthetase [Chitinophaga skermanii]